MIQSRIESMLKVGFSQINGNPLAGRFTLSE
jgi:hypothetical protein